MKKKRTKLHSFQIGGIELIMPKGTGKAITMEVEKGLGKEGYRNKKEPNHIETLGGVDGKETITDP